VEFDGPDADAYGRVTNPERFQAVVDAAETLIGELVDRFDVEKTYGTSAEDFPEWHEAAVTTVRLTPSVGASLVFMITDFPGVVIRFGGWAREAFPVCGCDACDERPAEVIRRMRDLVEAVFEGRLEEELTKRRARSTFSGSWGRSSRERRLRRGEWRTYGQLGTHRWPSWPAS